MKTSRIANAVGYIDDDLVSGANCAKAVQKNTWLKWGSVAACLAVLLMAAVVALPMMTGGDAPVPPIDHEHQYAIGYFYQINEGAYSAYIGGKVIAEDLHRGFADRTRATGARKNYLYFLDVKNYKPGARYTLSVEVSGYRGTDSYGNVIFSLAPYEPFTKVESDKRK